MNNAIKARGEGRGEGRQVPISPIASDASKWEIPTLLLRPQKHYGNGAPSFLVEANVGQKIDARNLLHYESFVGVDSAKFPRIGGR